MRDFAGDSMSTANFQRLGALKGDPLGDECITRRGQPVHSQLSGTPPDREASGCHKRNGEREVCQAKHGGKREAFSYRHRSTLRDGRRPTW